MTMGESIKTDILLSHVDAAPAVSPILVQDLLSCSTRSTGNLGRQFVPQRMPDGSPSLGRHTVSLIDVQATYVDAPIFRSNERRKLIWSNFLCLTARVRAVLPINAVMIGGSFASWKQSPSDIDVVFVLDKRHRARVSEDNDRKMLMSLGSGGGPKIRGWGIDSYTLDWEAIPITSKVNPAHRDYLIGRGYWDDWLQRSNSKNEEPNTGHAIPQRGYLEVIIDGYTADV